MTQDKEKINLNNMKIDFNAICEFEKTTGKSLFKVAKEKSFALNDLRALVKASFELEEDEAGKIIEEHIKEHGFTDFSNIINVKMEEFHEIFGKKK